MHIQSTLTNQIKQAYSTDSYLQSIINHLQQPTIHSPPSGLLHNISRYSLRDGCLFMDDTRLCVPISNIIRTALLHELHDTPTAGHLGVDKTYALAHKSFYWPNMHKNILAYVRSCDTCQRNKSSNTNTATIAQPLAIPTSRWSSVSMDFITQLPTTANHKYDAIFVVLCRLSKMAHFIPTYSNATAADTAYLFLHNIFRLHGMPQSIISDRDSKFTSHFWRELHLALGTKLHMSTAFHPQSDGQTERMNRTLEDILRAYVTDKQSDWDEHLSLAEFAYNNSLQASTHFTPFFMNYGEHPHTPVSLITPPSSPIADPMANDFLQRIATTLKSATDNLRRAQERQAAHTNANRLERIFAVGDLVLLDLRYMDTTGHTRQTHKFLAKHQGPFKILERVGQAAYRLALPSSWRVHNVFYVGLLKHYIDPRLPFPLRVSPQPPMLDDEGIPIFTVDRIIDQRSVGRQPNKRTEYKVLWLGYPIEAATWEPPSHLLKCWDKVEAWEAIRSTPPLPIPISTIHSPPPPDLISTTPPGPLRRSNRLAAQAHV